MVHVWTLYEFRQTFPSHLEVLLWRSFLLSLHVGALYQFQQSFQSRSACRRLPELARVEVLLCRTFLLSLSVNSASSARPYQSFRVRPASHTIDYDASLTRMGVLGPVWPAYSFALHRATFTIRGDDGLQFSIFAVNVAATILETEYDIGDRVECGV